MLVPRTQPTVSVTNDTEIGFIPEPGFTEPWTDEVGEGVAGVQAASVAMTTTSNTTEQRSRKRILLTGRFRPGQRYSDARITLG